MMIGQPLRSKRYEVTLSPRGFAHSSNSTNQRPLMIMISTLRSMLVVSVDQMCILLLVTSGSSAIAG